MIPLSVTLPLVGAGGLALISLLYVIVRFQRADASLTDAPTLDAARSSGPAPTRATSLVASGRLASGDARPERASEPAGDMIAGRVVTKFNSWLPDHSEVAHLWRSFDQLVREILCDELGATRVRCFHHGKNTDTNERPSKGAQPNDAGQHETRGPLLEHVLATGREYVAHDVDHSSLLKELSAQDADNWAWVWPVRTEQRSLGVVAVAELSDPDRLTPMLRQTIGPLITLFWSTVENLGRLHRGSRTDQASGVLTRSDFFQLAERTLTESYANHEPLVLLVLSLEGLRRLDDEGRWRERDALIKQVGALLLQRVRSDDLVGRFADERFVVALRRLDVGLGRLLSQKILAAANERVAELGLESSGVVLRVGVAPTAHVNPPLRELLALGFNAVDEARRQNMSVVVVDPNADVSGGGL